MSQTRAVSDQLILIIEDSDEDFEATKRILHKCNLENPIHRCSYGDDALDYLFKRGAYTKAERPGMILLDLNLPSIDGREILDKINKDSILKSIPTIIFTTSSDERDIKSCYENGANSYIQKPVDIEKLFCTISSLINYWFDVVILPKK